MPDALKRRLDPFFDETPANHVMHPNAAHGEAWPNWGFGAAIADVRTIMVHETDGFPARNRVSAWVHSYTHAADPDAGVGPQLYVSGDGSAFRLTDLLILTGHATFVNSWCVGVETGHFDGAQPPNHLVRWFPASANAEDLPGRKLFFCDDFADVPSEVFAVWWPTRNYAEPAETRPPPVGKMIFTEWQYLTWAKLARWLAEELRVPRNFPLLPYSKRPPDAADDPDEPFRRIVAADENRADIVRELHNHLAFDDADFDVAGGATAHYQASRRNPNTVNAPEFHLHVNPAAHSGQYRNKWINEAWLRLFSKYRGFHGHGFSGSVWQGKADHDDCPGELFDWHRFARSVYDWWWMPFDFDAAYGTTAVPVREYRAATRTTALVEYFFHYDAQHFIDRANAAGIQGANSSPNTFRLEDGAYVYAAANGQLVAARMLAPGANVSMAFALVKHEVYHLPSPLIGAEAALNQLMGAPFAQPIDQGRLDYDAEPVTVFTLYMHLGTPGAFDFAQPSANNPDWLNRALVRFKEADLGLAFYNSAHHGGTNAADWTAPPPARPHLYDQWQTDHDALRTFFQSLQAGDVAIAPVRTAGMANTPTPVEVLLGDVLGTAGVTRVENNVTSHGVRVELFSNLVVDAAFTAVPNQQSWNPGNAALPAVQYPSEWLHAPTQPEADALRAIGVDPTLVAWWPAVAGATATDLGAAADAVLPANGTVFHYWPLRFMQWLNEVTRASEWPKYRATDDAGNALALPPAARNRWV